MVNFRVINSAVFVVPFCISFLASIYLIVATLIHFLAMTIINYKFQTFPDNFSVLLFKIVKIIDCDFALLNLSAKLVADKVTFKILLNYSQTFSE